MINFENQSVRDDLSPVFQPPSTDYTGRMPVAESAKVGEYDIRPFDLRTLDVPPDIQEALDNGMRSRPYTVKYLTDDGRKELQADDIPLEPGVLTLVVKAAVKKNNGGYVIPPIKKGDEIINHGNTAFMYLEAGATYVQRKDNEWHLLIAPIQNGGSG